LIPFFDFHFQLKLEFHIPNQGRSHSILAVHYFVVIFELSEI